jgi:hypothetical protein
MEYVFTKNIRSILADFFGSASSDIFEKSDLLQYINIKTRSADKGSKARGSFANLYAIYVLVEDYIKNGFNKKNGYANYEGAVFSKLFLRQRQLPFGKKLQNHALNHRLNEEYKKFFPTSELIPILRNAETQRYWINENLLTVTVASKKYNLAEAIIIIIDEYVKAKMEAFDLFIKTCTELEILSNKDTPVIEKFITDLLAPNVDARLFEIVSYSILKYYYNEQKVYFGFEMEKLTGENLKLYKTGRTNANDGGIDYVMRPLGRFFQVTETLDVKKYFLDIDKIEKYPLTFVIKSSDKIEHLYNKLKEGAEKQYSVKAIVESYMKSIEELINIPTLQERFKEAVKNGYLRAILNEIIKQSRVEFNYEEEEDEESTVNV